MANSKLILYEDHGNPFSTVARIALRETELEFETAKESQIKNIEQKLLEKIDPAYRRSPVLVHNKNVVNGSKPIVDYIDKVSGRKTRLLPSDAEKREKTKCWVNFIEENMYEIGKSVRDLESNKAKEAKKDELIECFLLLQTQLGDKHFFGGESFGFLDVVAISFYGWTYTLDNNFSQLIKEGNKLMVWATRCMQRKSVSKSLPKKYTRFMM